MTSLCPPTSESNLCPSRIRLKPSWSINDSVVSIDVLNVAIRHSSLACNLHANIVHRSGKGLTVVCNFTQHQTATERPIPD